MGMWQAPLHMSVFAMASVMAFFSSTVFLSGNHAGNKKLSKYKMTLGGMMGKTQPFRCFEIGGQDKGIHHCIDHVDFFYTNLNGFHWLQLNVVNIFWQTYIQVDVVCKPCRIVFGLNLLYLVQHMHNSNQILLSMCQTHQIDEHHLWEKTCPNMGSQRIQDSQQSFWYHPNASEHLRRYQMLPGQPASSSP